MTMLRGLLLKWLHSRTRLWNHLFSLISYNDNFHIAFSFKIMGKGDPQLRQSYMWKNIVKYIRISGLWLFIICLSGTNLTFFNETSDITCIAWHNDQNHVDCEFQPYQLYINYFGETILDTSFDTFMDCLKLLNFLHDLVLWLWISWLYCRGSKQFFNLKLSFNTCNLKISSIFKRFHSLKIGSLFSLYLHQVVVQIHFL